MPSSWRPGLRGIAVFERWGAGASAMGAVYRPVAPGGYPATGSARLAQGPVGCPRCALFPGVPPTCAQGRDPRDLAHVVRRIERESALVRDLAHEGSAIAKCSSLGAPRWRGAD